jgi:L-asparaginase
VMNDWIHSAQSLVKVSTTAVQTFMSPLRGLIGTVAYGVSEFYRVPNAKFCLQSEFSVDGVTLLPRVDIIYGCTDMPADLIDASVEKGAKGIVIAGVGNGNMPKNALDACARAAKKGVVVVRSTRVATGNVSRNVEVDDDKLGLVASYDLNPQKSRILLSFALLKPRKMMDIQNLFIAY